MVLEKVFELGRSVNEVTDFVGKLMVIHVKKLQKYTYIVCIRYLAG